MSDGIIDGAGFHVELDALTDAATGISHSIQSENNFELTRLCGPANMYGHRDLHSALATLCDRWSDGLDLLTEDAKTVSTVLSQVAASYRAVDDTAASSLTSDPGIKAMGDG